VSDLKIPSAHGKIPARLYRPLVALGRIPGLVFFHGGGWVIGDLESHDILCRRLANAGACAVLAVDHRLAPEHKFPAAVEDAITATQWVFANAQMLEIDPERIAVGGDSEGASRPFPDQIHGFLTMGVGFPTTKLAISEIGEALKQSLSKMAG
jgi:acetyl esterase